MLIKYNIEAEYIARVHLVVEVEEGDDPMDSASWGEILEENQSDLSLYDIVDAEPIEEDAG
tara:strand:+ start:495 stop:677 length:183 start_codon:yes stop_codon:yes gene_type:complete